MNKLDPEKYKEITLEEFIAAIEKNGWEKFRGSYINESSDGTIRACAFGQAAMNLEVDYADLDYAIVQISRGLRNMVVDLNDKSDLSIREIGYAARQRYSKAPHFLKRIISVRKHKYPKAKS